MQLHEIVRSYGRHVEALGIDIDGSWGWQDLEDPDSAGWGRPGIAEDRLVFAVEQGGVGRIWFKRKYGSRLVKRLFDSTTATWLTLDNAVIIFELYQMVHKDH